MGYGTLNLEDLNEENGQVSQTAYQPVAKLLDNSVDAEVKNC